MNATLQTMLHTWENGGLVMAAMALLALVTYAVAANLLMYLFHRGLPRMTDAD